MKLSDVILNRIECPQGQYSFGGTTDCSQCPVGYSCPRKNAGPIPCSPGWYANAAVRNIFKSFSFVFIMSLKLLYSTAQYFCYIAVDDKFSSLFFSIFRRII